MTKGVIRIRKSKKIRQYNHQREKSQREKQRSTKHYTENKGQCNKTPLKTGDELIHVLRRISFRINHLISVHMERRQTINDEKAQAGTNSYPLWIFKIPKYIILYNMYVTCMATKCVAILTQKRKCVHITWTNKC
jgi:hypothetical protein